MGSLLRKLYRCKNLNVVFHLSINVLSLFSGKNEHHATFTEHLLIYDSVEWLIGISASCVNASSATMRVATECYIIHETFSYTLKRRKCFGGGIATHDITFDVMKGIKACQ